MYYHSLFSAVPDLQLWTLFNTNVTPEIIQKLRKKEICTSTSGFAVQL